MAKSPPHRNSGGGPSDKAQWGAAAVQVASWLEEAAALFPFPDPHLHAAARREYLHAFCRKGDSPMGVLSWNAIEASGEVFSLLVSYARAHPQI